MPHSMSGPNEPTLSSSVPAFSHSYSHHYPRPTSESNGANGSHGPHGPHGSHGLHGLHGSNGYGSPKSQSGSVPPEGPAPVIPHGGMLSREFVARRISEGETGRLKEELKCQSCGKGYKHVSSLAKHLWEHTPEWNVTSKLLISKHQQVQLLEAASILVSMNEHERERDSRDHFRYSQSMPKHDPSVYRHEHNGNGNGNSSITGNGSLSIPSIPVDARRNSITKPSPYGRRYSITSQRRSSITSAPPIAATPSSIPKSSPVITDAMFPGGDEDFYDTLASPYQRVRRMSALRHYEDYEDHEDKDNEENDRKHTPQSNEEDGDRDPDDSPGDTVFGEMD
uniref:ARAD1C18018p n=1 Tax=Blastobotrys adeninivorans TaxID=409370 RepID=A0A060T745_BLAAD